VTCGSLMTTIRRRPSANVQWRGRWGMMKNLNKQASNCEDRFLKILFTLSQCRITKGDCFRDLLSRSQMHIDERGEGALVAQQRKRWKTRCVGGSWLFVLTRSTTAAHIYREDLPRVTTSRNRLGLFLLKHIRHGLIAKINSEMRSRTCGALSQILVDYSCVRWRPMPRLAHRARVFLPFSSPSWTCKCIECNLPYK
jgi:hypothetical protein